MLFGIGIYNVLNTCCPTTWNITPLHCSKIPFKKSENVVFTLTDYNKSRESDESLFKILKESYKRIYFWIQGDGDFEYVKSFQNLTDSLVFISPKLAKYDQVLDSNECDYIGTRLHAGIRAIQKGKRTLILSVDNRATEISRDVNLNVKPRNDINGVDEFISGNYITDIKIPLDSISVWKKQFLN
jgi:hypothetical protein